MNIDEKIDLCRWLIIRHDTLRGSTSNRAAIILSADAVIITLVLFILDKSLNKLNQLTLIEMLLYILFVSMTIVFLLISIVWCLNAIASIWRPIGEEISLSQDGSERLYYNARDTIRTFKTPNQLLDSINSIEKESELSFAIMEMWGTYNLYRKMYEYMRKALKLFVISFFPLIALLVIYIAIQFN